MIFQLFLFSTRPTGQSQTRGSVEIVVKKFNDCVEYITAAKKTTGYVTVNGINLMDLQRLRQNSDDKTTVKRKSTP